MLEKIKHFFFICGKMHPADSAMMFISFGLLIGMLSLIGYVLYMKATT